MHLGLNLVYLVPGETGGTETYARELIASLATASPNIQMTAFINREAAVSDADPFDGLVRTLVVPVNARNRAQWVRGEQQLLPRLASQAGVDLVHSLANTGPLRGRFRRVVTIHDLHFLKIPEAHLGINRYGMGVLVPLAARRSDRVIAPSAATGTDLSTMLRVPARKVDVIPEGVGQTRNAEPLSDSEIRAWLGEPDRPIVLSVSAKRPHKNLRRLIEAFALIPPERRPLLVVPGYPTPYEEKLRDRVRELGLQADVRLLRWIREEELEGLYQAASCLVCPSLHEGFGLPVLEAMARGVPVACSSGGALEEVADGAAVIFDPLSTQQISDAVQWIVGSPEEADALRRAGRMRASKFSWRRAAEQTLVSYERALGSRA